MSGSPGLENQPRRLGSAADIRRAILRYLDTTIGPDEAAHIRLPDPELGEPDKTGCNWTLDFRSVCEQHAEQVRDAARQARQQWLLRP